MAGVLVADDEAIVRSTLAATIAHGAPELGPVGQAGSGDEAISMARQMRPSIVLMDVKMPGLDGLAATRAIRAENPRTKVIMLTAYDEFSFSQEALRLGAVDYLLKPVRPAILINELVRVKRESDAEELSQRASEQASLRLRDTLPLVEARLVADLIHASSAALPVVGSVLRHLEKSVTWPAVMVIDVDHYASAVKGMEPERVERFCGLLTDIVRRVIGDPGHCLIGQVRPGVLVAIISTAERLATTAEIRALGHAVRYAVESSAPVTVTIGIGHRHARLELAHFSYSEAVCARWRRPYVGGNSVIHIDDVGSVDDRGRSYPIDLERELIASVRQGHRQASEALMERIVAYLLGGPDEPPETVATRLTELVALLSRAAIDAGVPCGEALDVSYRQISALGQPKSGDEVRTWALAGLSELLNQIAAGERGDCLVERAVAHMRENLSSPGLELKDVANALHVSPSHLAHLFKARMQVSWLKYLTDMRMEEARRLLATTAMTIAAVARAAGYEDPGYFHRVFRRETGMTPCTYRQAGRGA